MAYVRGSNPIWYFVDLVGLGLNDQYWISFLQNTVQYLPQPVYMGTVGLTPNSPPIPWSNPLQFYPNGTLPDNIYGDDSLVYRLEIRRGPNQNDPLIYVINNYSFGNGSSSEDISGSDENQISNPQFAFVNFSLQGISPVAITYTTAGTYPIAPGWDLVLTGSGSCTATQLIFSGNDNQVGNPFPPYALRINSSGSWTGVTLRQRFFGNGGIWGNQFVSMSVLARSDDSIARAISLIYNPSSPGTPKVIGEGLLSTGAYGLIEGVVALPVSTNSTLNNAAYVDIQIVLPITGIVDLSNVQVIGQTTSTLPSVFLPAADETLERQTDHLFHYYNHPLQYKPIPSWLVGWDFPLNPTQLGSTYSPSATGANSSAYVWDSTILFQSANSSIGVTRGSAGQIVLTATAATQCALIQYLDTTATREVLQDQIAVFIAANTEKLGGLGCTISLWFTQSGSLPSLLSNNSLVATLNSAGKPATFNNSWTEVPRLIGEDATFVLGSQNGSANYTQNMFNTWNIQGNAEANTATYFAIVIGFAAMAIGDSVNIYQASMCSGSIATRPAPKTKDETLRECQYFYENSYPAGTVPGAATSVGSKFRNAIIYNDEVASAGCVLYPNEIEVQFFQEKRVQAGITVYSVDGTINTIETAIRVGSSLPTPSSGTNPRNTAIGIWGTPVISDSNFILTTNSAGGASSIMSISTPQPAAVGELFFHYVADARLGIA